MSFFNDMMVRIIITIAIEEWILCWLVLKNPKNTTLYAVGIVLVTIVSLGIQLWWVMERYGIKI